MLPIQQRLKDACYSAYQTVRPYATPRNLAIAGIALTAFSLYALSRLYSGTAASIIPPPPQPSKPEQAKAPGTFSGSASASNTESDSSQNIGAHSNVNDSSVLIDAPEMPLDTSPLPSPSNSQQQPAASSNHQENSNSSGNSVAAPARPRSSSEPNIRLVNTAPSLATTDSSAVIPPPKITLAPHPRVQCVVTLQPTQIQNPKEFVIDSSNSQIFSESRDSYKFTAPYFIMKPEQTNSVSDIAIAFCVSAIPFFQTIFTPEAIAQATRRRQLDRGMICAEQCVKRYCHSFLEKAKSQGITSLEFPKKFAEIAFLGRPIRSSLIRQWTNSAVSEWVQKNPNAIKKIVWIDHTK